MVSFRSYLTFVVPRVLRYNRNTFEKVPIVIFKLEVNSRWRNMRVRGGSRKCVRQPFLLRRLENGPVRSSEEVIFLPGKNLINVVTYQGGKMFNGGCLRDWRLRAGSG